MFRITLPANRAEPDMIAVAKAFDVGIDVLENGLQTGIISRWIEVGTADADNKPHHIFASETLGVRVDVDEVGDVRYICKYDAPPLNRKHDVPILALSGGSKTTDKRPNPNMKEISEISHQARLDALLDEALDLSFPASDPIAISIERQNG